MAYIEIQKRGKKQYYYLAHSVRIGSNYKKARVFLGVDLSSSQVKEEIKKKEKILSAKISVIEQTEKSFFSLKANFKKKFLSSSQIGALEKHKLKFAKKSKLTDKDVLRNIRESFLIHYTYNTNASEGNTISLKETELIFTKGVIPKSHSLREVHEIENTFQAYEFIEKCHGTLDTSFILTLHKLVTHNTLVNKSNEGRFRRKSQDVGMTGSKHIPPHGGRQVRKLVDELIQKYQQSKLSGIEKAILFHSEFILIHPFIDGNGRVSRLLFNWMLLRLGFPPIDFPSKEHIEYTDLMEVARDGDAVPLTLHLADKIKRACTMSTK